MLRNFSKVFSKSDTPEKRNPIPSGRYARNQNSLRKSEMSGMNNMLYKMYEKNPDFQSYVDKYLTTGGASSTARTTASTARSGNQGSGLAQRGHAEF